MSKQTENVDSSLLKFPCDFEVKAMGKNLEGFETHVIAIVRRHLDSNIQIEVRSRLSRADKYLSVSCSFEASSQTQLDSIYIDLSNDERVLVAL